VDIKILKCEEFLIGCLLTTFPYAFVRWQNHTNIRHKLGLWPIINVKHLQFNLDDSADANGSRC